MCLWLLPASAAASPAIELFFWLCSIRGIVIRIMATETLLGKVLRTDNLDSVEALAREAETLKAKLAEEKAKLNDVDSEITSVFFMMPPLTKYLSIDSFEFRRLMIICKL